MKLVKEHIEFERGKDPLDAMDIGLTTKIKEWILDNRYAFRYPDNDTVPDQIRGMHIYPATIFKYVNIKKLRINAKCWVDISSTTKYITLPEYIKFGIIEDDFACSLSEKLDYWKYPFPKEIMGNLSFYMSKRASIHITEREIREVCKVGGIIRIKVEGK